MQVSVETTGTLGRKMTVQIPCDRIDSTVTGRIKDLAKQVKIKGFRPGRVPMKVLEQRFGRQVRQEVVGEVVQETFREAVEQESLRPAAMPQISTNNPKANTDLEYTAEFDVFPEIGEIDVSELALNKPVAEVAEADVDQMIETLREQRRTWQEVERGADEGDLVMFKYFVTLDDDKRYPEEGEENGGTIIGSGMILTELEEGIKGTAADAEASLDVTFPEDYRIEDLAGKTGKTTISVTKVQEGVLPEVDAEFIASFGVEDGDMEQFRSDVQDNLQRELNQAISTRQRGEVVDALLEKFSDLELPAGMVDQESRGLQQQMMEQAKRMGQENAETPPLENFQDQAEKRVRSALVLSELARQAEIQPDATRMRDAINTVASTYEDPDEVVRLYYSDENLLASVQNSVMEEQVIEWVMEHANTTEEKLSFDELLRPGQA